MPVGVWVASVHLWSTYRLEFTLYLKIIITLSAGLSGRAMSKLIVATIQTIVSWKFKSDTT